MEMLLIAVIFIQFLYQMYSDSQNRKERESLTLKIMSKDATEYKNLMEPAPATSEKEEDDPYVTMEEAGVERILNAK